MIQYATENIKFSVCQMWKICFGDSDEFIELFFTHKYRNENTLVYLHQGKVVASLQMLPYSITFYGEKIPFFYLAGLCTLPEFRNKGIMHQLMDFAHQEIRKRNIPLSILVPAEGSLFGFYNKFSYEQVFDAGKTPLPSLKHLMNESSGIEDAYKRFNDIFNVKDFTVQKTINDFQLIIQDSEMEEFPDKYNLPAQARIIDPELFLSKYAKNNPNVSFSIKVSDDLFGDKSFKIEKGKVSFIKEDSCVIEVDIKVLCRLLFGFQVDILGKPLDGLFPIHHPQINLMLE